MGYTIWPDRPYKLRKELVEVDAVAVGWIEAIDKYSR